MTRNIIIIIITRNITHNGRTFWLQRQPSLMWRLLIKPFLYQCLTLCWPGILPTMAGRFGCRDSHHWCGDSGIKTVSLSVLIIVLTRNITHNGRTFWLQRQPSLMWRFGNKNRFSISAWHCVDQEYYPLWHYRYYYAEISHHWCGLFGNNYRYYLSLSWLLLSLTINITHYGIIVLAALLSAIIDVDYSGIITVISISAWPLCWPLILPTMALLLLLAIIMYY